MRRVVQRAHVIYQRTPEPQIVPDPRKRIRARECDSEHAIMCAFGVYAEYVECRYYQER